MTVYNVVIAVVSHNDKQKAFLAGGCLSLRYICRCFSCKEKNIFWDEATKEHEMVQNKGESHYMCVMNYLHRIFGYLFDHRSS